MNEYEDLKDFEGLYKINREGDVYSMLYNKVMKPRIKNNGYKTICLYNHTITKHCSLHRLLAIQFLDNPENKRCVDHIDRNKLNNSLDNLRWATNSENQQNRGVVGRIRVFPQSFQARYCISPYKEKTKYFKTKEECEAWLEQMKIEYPR